VCGGPTSSTRKLRANADWRQWCVNCRGRNGIFRKFSGGWRRQRYKFATLPARTQVAHESRSFTMNHGVQAMKSKCTNSIHAPITCQYLSGKHTRCDEPKAYGSGDRCVAIDFVHDMVRCASRLFRGRAWQRQRERAHLDELIVFMSGFDSSFKFIPFARRVLTHQHSHLNH